MLSAKPWRPLAVLQYCAAVLFCICAGGLLRSGLEQFGVRGFREPADLGSLVLGTFSFQGVACFLIFVFFRYHRVNWKAGFGFSGPDLFRAIRLAVLVFILALPLVWLLQWTGVAILTWLGHPPNDQAAVQLMESTRSCWSRGYLAFFAVGLAPVAEEFIFRGMLYPFIKQLGWPRLAFVGVSFMFALIHFDAGTFLALFALALILTWLYEITDNLLASITVHALFNGANLVMLALKHLYPSPDSR